MIVERDALHREFKKQDKKKPYPFDPESATEIARRVDQDRLLSSVLGGVFPEQLDISALTHVLDLGCGPGEWVQEAAWAYPEMEITGVDSGRITADYARATAHVRHLENATFLTMDICQPLDFSDASFDLVHAQQLAFLIPANEWTQVLQECRRVTHPGGIICLTESEMSHTTSHAITTLQELFLKALKQTGWYVSPNGHQLGITTRLGQLLRDVGCQHIERQAHVLEWSVGTSEHWSWYQQMLITLHTVRPFLLDNKVVTEKDLDCLSEQIIIDILSENFAAIRFLLTCWGEVPLAIEQR